MKRCASGVGAVLRVGYVCGALLAVGCAPPPAALDGPMRPGSQSGGPPAASEPRAVAERPAAPERVVASAGADTAAMQIREIKIIEDNGQQGLFTKLSRAPREVTHFTLASPNRLLVEMAGGGSSVPAAEQYRVDNPLIENVRVAMHEGKIRLTITLRGEQIPSYTVNDLNDTVVVFFGEPQGGGEPVREQIVYTQRPIQGKAAIPDSVVNGRPVEPDDEVIAEGAEGAAPRRDYYGQPVSLDLKDADIHNVLRLLAEVSKLNIVATDDVQGKVTLRLFDVPWDQALDIVLQVMNLESVQEGNVIRISTVKRLREEREELRRAQEAAREVEPLQVAYMRVNYAKAKKLAELIGGSRRAQAGGGGGAGRAGGQADDGVLTSRGSVLVDEFTNTLVVRDIERGIANARELVRRLDVQTPQILIESKIVEATSDFARDLGVQWGYRASVGPQSGTTTGKNFPGTIGFGGSGLTTAPSGVPFLADFPAAGNFAPGSGSALDLALGSLDGAHALDLRITALEEEGAAKIISRPRVVTLNNVPATIKSLTVLRVRLPGTGTVISTGAGGAAGGGSNATEKIETGIILIVTPQVSSDGFVLLDMFAKSSQADFTRTVDNIPTEITREATSHVLVRDGETIVLGGIYRDTVNDTTQGLPFFRDIPGIRWLFQSNSKLKRREDLLVFMTPRIVGGKLIAGGAPSAAELWERRGTYEPAEMPTAEEPG